MYTCMNVCVFIGKGSNGLLYSYQRLPPGTGARMKDNLVQKAFILPIIFDLFLIRRLFSCNTKTIRTNLKDDKVKKKWQSIRSENSQTQSASGALGRTGSPCEE